MPILDDRYRGLAPTILVLIIVWAVAAVLMLTGTLVAARQIDDKVNEEITGTVSEIDRDTDNVKLAERTADIAEQIEPNLDDIKGQLDTVLREARSINRRVGPPGGEEIQGTARKINGTVRDIQGTVFSIGGTVRGIHGGVSSIGASVQSVHRSVISIQSSARNILSEARVIDRTGWVRRAPGTGLPRATAICGVLGINVRADIGINTVGGIKDDLANVLGQVGEPTGRLHTVPNQPGTIHEHANSIDCRIDELTTIPVVGGNINPSGSSQYCNR